MKRSINVSGKSTRTLTNYGRQLAHLAKHYEQLPTELDSEQVLDYLHLVKANGSPFLIQARVNKYTVHLIEDITDRTVTISTNKLVSVSFIVVTELHLNVLLDCKSHISTPVLVNVINQFAFQPGKQCYISRRINLVKIVRVCAHPAGPISRSCNLIALPSYRCGISD